MSTLKPQSKPGFRWIPIAVASLILIITFFILTWGFFFVRDLQAGKNNTPQLLIVLFAIIWGVGGVIMLFTTANFFVEQLPEAWTQRLQPFIFIGPAILMLTWALVIPTIRTIIASFYDEASVNFVFFKNYIYVFTNPAMLTVFRNNLLWVVFGTTLQFLQGC